MRAPGRYRREFTGYLLSRQRGALLQGGVALVLATIGNLAAGVVLGSITDTLERLPGFMVLIPPAIGMRGNIYGALGSRLGTYLHTGLLGQGLRRGSALTQNIWATSALSLVLSALIAFYARGATAIFGLNTMGVWDFFLISMLGGMMAGILLLAFTIGLSVLCRRQDWDMDNVSAPLVTTTGDMLTVPSLFVASFALELHVLYWVVTGVLIALPVASLIVGLRTRQDIFRRVFRESLPVLGAAGLVSVLAGLTLEVRLDQLVSTPAFLVLIPPFLAGAGALGGMLSARLSSRLHLGTVQVRSRPGREVGEEIAIVYVYAFMVFVLIGLGTEVAAALVGLESAGLAATMTVSLVAGLLATTATVLAAYYAAVSTFRFGLDPDSLGMPAVTSTMDLFGTLSLLAVILLLGV